MNNNIFNKLAAIILLVLIAGLLVFFYVSLNRMDKKLTDLQTNVVDNSNSINEVVNFFNANINAQDIN
jgi:beta-lactamase regulating signal transducer with metallopeptidase domain